MSPRVPPAVELVEANGLASFRLANTGTLSGHMPLHLHSMLPPPFATAQDRLLTTTWIAGT